MFQWPAQLKTMATRISAALSLRCHHPYRARRGAARVISACAALAIYAGLASAQLTVTNFNLQAGRDSLGEPHLVVAGDGNVLLHISGLSREGSLGTRDVLYVLDNSGNIKDQLELPRSGSISVVPYQKGFLTHQYVESHSHLIPGSSTIFYLDLSLPKRQQVTLDRRKGMTQMLVSPDRNDLYILDTRSPPGPTFPRIAKVASNQKADWSKSIPFTDTGTAVATNDGVVFVQLNTQGKSSYVLRAIGRDGKERWTIGLPDRPRGELKFIPTGFLVVGLTSSEAALLVDSKTGEIRAQAALPPHDVAVPTDDGLLLTGPMLGQSYVATLKADGTFSWLRRFKRDEQLQTFLEGAMTSDKTLLLLAEGESPAMYSFVSLDRTAEALQLERSACLTVPWQRAVEVDQRLQRQGIHAVSPNAPPIESSKSSVSRSTGCPAVTESQYVQFMEELSSELSSDNRVRGRVPSIAIQLLEAGAPLELSRYGVEAGMCPSCGVHAEFSIPHSQGKNFAHFLTDAWQPHIARLLQLQEDFQAMTGFSYVASIPRSLDYRKAISELESAAVTLNRRIKGMSPERLAYVREKPPTGWVRIVLTPSGFGNGFDKDPYGSRPLDVADATLVQIVKQHRKDVARGRIIIRD